MRLSRVLTAALITPVLPLFVAAPAHAVGENTICVGSPAGPCDETAVSISAALTTANTNGLDNTVWVGPGTYTDGPYMLNGTGHALTLQGSGNDTILTLPASPTNQNYVTSVGATVRDLRLRIEPTNSSQDRGLYVYSGATVQNVYVDGTGVSNAQGIYTGVAQLSNVTVQMELGTGNTAVYGSGAATITDSTLTADTAFTHSGGGTPDTLSRTTLTVGNAAGVTLDSGTVNIDNSVIDLGTGNGTALRAANFNNGTTPKAINADHVTIVGGNGSSRGVWAYASAYNGGALQDSAVTVTNSIIRGPAKSLQVDASNDGNQGGSSSATIDISYTDYDPATTVEAIGANGTGGITAGAGNLNVDPLFAGVADYHLTAGSPVIDKGSQAAAPQSTDRDGNPRVVDGDGNGSAIRDMGAFEYPDNVAPQTTITGGPAAPTRDTTPTFTFASEPGATFACSIDAGSYAPCSSPYTAAALANGSHTFRVRATDQANNTDATPAARGFTVDTVAPNTTITRKPPKVTSKKRVRFAFTASEVGSHFQCRLDRGAWKSCASPRRVTVKKGRHRFSVRAVDAAGNVDATPSTYRFRRV